LKVCTQCKKELPLNVFSPRKDRNGKPHSWCDVCRAKRLEAVVKSRKGKQDKISEYKRQKGCCVCGFTESVALDFHHLDPTIKDNAISQMLSVHTPIDIIFKEIEKCVVICANHHRMFHAGLVDLP
jgi:hypothetical protein